MIVVCTVVSGSATAWATYLLRHELRPRVDREPLWRRVILTRRENLRVGAAVCGVVAMLGGLAGSMLGDRAATVHAVTTLLTAGAVLSAVVSLVPATDRRLVVYRDSSGVVASAAVEMPVAQRPLGAGARRRRSRRGERRGS